MKKEIIEIEIQRLFVDELVKVIHTKEEWVDEFNYLMKGLTDEEINDCKVEIDMYKNKISKLKLINFNLDTDKELFSYIENKIIKNIKKLIEKKLDRFITEQDRLSTIFSNNIIVFFTNKENQKLIPYCEITKKHNTIITEDIDDVYYTYSTNMLMTTDVVDIDPVDGTNNSSEEEDEVKKMRMAVGFYYDRNIYKLKK